MATASEHERLLAVEKNLVTCREDDTRLDRIQILVHVKAGRSLGNLDGHAAQGVNQVEEALEIDDCVIVDLDVENVVERAHEQIVAAVLDHGVYLAIAMTVDFDAQVSRYGNDIDLLGLLVDACDHDGIRAFAIVVLVNGLPPLAGITAHEEHVIRLVCRGSGEVRDVLVAPDVVRDVVVPQGDGDTAACEHDHERDGNAQGDLLAPGHAALATDVFVGGVLFYGPLRLRAIAARRIRVPTNLGPAAGGGAILGTRAGAHARVGRCAFYVLARATRTGLELVSGTCLRSRPLPLAA